MASSTALLPKDNTKKNDHPIFSRVCHSPWVSIGQKSLVVLRLATAAYTITTLGMLIDYEQKHYKRGWSTVFDFSNITFLLQTVYALTAFTWTFMHLYYPHHSNGEQTIMTRIQRFFSPPKQNPKTKNRAFFSIFYTAAQSFPHVATAIQWAVLVPMNRSVDHPHEIFKHGWIKGFYYVNKYGVNSLLALIEVFFLSSIRQQHPIWAHVQGLIVLSLSYIGWAYVGYIVTDQYPYYFLDKHEVGWEYVVTAVTSFVAAGQVAFAFTYQLTRFREMLCDKMDKKASDGYMQLPH